MTSDELAALAASMPFAKLIGFQVIEAGKDEVVAKTANSSP
jgi:1,4-dihydroxy-2-naphthoyl-CoA hydrolase